MASPLLRPGQAGVGKRDFMSLLDLDEGEVAPLFARAADLKERRRRGEVQSTLRGKVLGMVFEKASTRTRVSFEVGMFELGGHAVFLSAEGSQIARGEPIQDTARVLGGYCHGIVIRTFGQHRAETLARHAPVPVLNGLTDLLHPCQLLADLFTVWERLGAVHGVRYAWIGDGNNMANSWCNAAALLGLDLVLACPAGFDPDADIMAAARARLSRSGRGSIRLVRDPAEAAAGADVLSTDVWASMGQEEQAAARRVAFAGYLVDEKLVARASRRAIVLHCLPAHRGEEIAASVLDGPQSAVWQQAENRLHVQKAVLELFLAAAVPAPP
ncbi:MAG TPA: ornithine carbamoyltransferase [Candidatus Acidoferrum sp.]|nr:ornithine carbamoyltransferase [Candidatus Acidoferrum sp.]